MISEIFGQIFSLKHSYGHKLDNLKESKISEKSTIKRNFFCRIFLSLQLVVGCRSDSKRSVEGNILYFSDIKDFVAQNSPQKFLYFFRLHFVCSAQSSAYFSSLFPTFPATTQLTLLSQSVSLVSTSRCILYNVTVYSSISLMKIMEVFTNFANYCNITRATISESLYQC